MGAIVASSEQGVQRWAVSGDGTRWRSCCCPDALERSVVLVDDGGCGCVSTAGYIGLPREVDVRDIVDDDMFTRVGGSPIHSSVPPAQRVFRQHKAHA